MFHFSIQPDPGRTVLRLTGRFPAHRIDELDAVCSAAPSPLVMELGELQDAVPSALAWLRDRQEAGVDLVGLSPTLRLRLASPRRRETPAARVLVVDDHPLLRISTVCALVGPATTPDEPIIEVVGEAEDGVDAVSRVRELRPDVVLMDLDMPRMNGIEATRTIRRRWPQVRVLLLTASECRADLDAALQGGAWACLRKPDDRRRYRAAVGRALRGEREPARASPRGRRRRSPRPLSS